MLKPAKSPKPENGQKPPTEKYPVTQRNQLAMPEKTPMTLPSVFGKK